MPRRPAARDGIKAGVAGGALRSGRKQGEERAAREDLDYKEKSRRNIVLVTGFQMANNRCGIDYGRGEGWEYKGDQGRA